ncbi:ABC transporter substrate-binding protein [Ancylobacter sp. G4_0304]|uniref:ABC transporter substrate-binding protein n=1 Tax=Ancylobacter sp. G4_0304 TaxID=3114289 RepID=UPI0039C67F00
MTTLLTRRMFTLAAGVSLGILTATLPAYAATPQDTLVEAFAIDDIISLDPAESFELSAAEVISNSYSQLVKLDINDTTRVVGDLAESWTVSPDGLTFTFKLKPGVTFASGNPLTAEDIAWAFERMAKLDKSPAFLIGQLGITGDNVTEKARAVDATTFALTIDKAYAPSFVLNVMAASPLSAVDKKLVLQHVKEVTPSADYKYDNDFGNAWLKLNHAGSGPFAVRTWRANEIVILDRNDTYFGDKAKLARVIFRHMKESAAQRLALEAGDVDVARNLEPGDMEAIAKNKNLALDSSAKGTVYYISLNQKNPTLAKPEVRDALKYLVDYEALGKTLIKGIGEVHQSFLPGGQLGALDDNPYKLDIGKAKALLAKAGLPDGFTVTMDVRSTQPVSGIAEAFQQSAAKAGVKVEIIPGDGKQTLTKYRARNHDIYIGQWGSDYWDPHSNAQTFSSNPDNSDAGKSKTLAWRNAWDIPAMTAKTDAALMEKESGARAKMYGELQRDVMTNGPFIIIYQQTEVAGHSSKLKGFKLGPSFDSNFLAPVAKN